MNKLFILTFFFFSCSQKGTGDIKSASNHFDTIDVNTIQQKDEINKNIGIGVILIKWEVGLDFKIPIWNKDKTFWKELSKDNLLNPQILPFALDIEKHLLIFRCIEEDESFYKIIVNERNEDEKYINKKLVKAQFETWQNHILSNVFSVEFDIENNPLFGKIDDNNSKIMLIKSIYGGYTFQPVECEKGWLKVKWEDDYGNENEGWVKWQENGKLLLDFYYES